MDNYPEHLAPEFDEGGGVKTPFNEWWPRVRDDFPTVPEEVAREWLHRHWGHSPYEWLKSADYRFERVTRPTEWLKDVRYSLNKFSDDFGAVWERGKFLTGEHLNLWGGTWLTKYMLGNGDFPTPPILLDNRDRHLVDQMYGDPDYFPPRYIIVEGHNRFELGYYLSVLGQMKPQLDFYVMSRTID